MSKYLVDAWAWIEYLRGSEAGLKVKEKVEGELEILTHVVTLAEVVSKVKREGMDAEVAWKSVTTLSKIVLVDEVDSKEAGLLHAILKSQRASFSLADAFLLHAARKTGVKILTGDPDFRGISEAIMIWKS